MVELLQPVERYLLSFEFKRLDFSSTIFLGSGSYHPQWTLQNSTSLEVSNTFYGCRMGVFQFPSNLSSYLNRTEDTCWWSLSKLEWYLTINWLCRLLYRPSKLELALFGQKMEKLRSAKQILLRQRSRYLPYSCKVNGSLLPEPYLKECHSMSAYIRRVSSVI